MEMMCKRRYENKDLCVKKMRRYAWGGEELFSMKIVECSLEIRKDSACCQELLPYSQSNDTSIIYSSIRNCRRPTLTQNGPPNGGAMLKNSAAYISSAPCRRVVDA